MSRYNTKLIWVMSTFVLALGYFISCTKANQVLDTATSPTANLGTDLLAVKTTTPPTTDGTIDPVWSNATKLNIVATVPDPCNSLFTGYIGQSFNVSLRALYDNDNIYFLAEISDNAKSSKL